MNRKIIVTPENYLSLQEKIISLEKINESVIERLGLAALDGDLSENYDFVLLQEKKEILAREIATLRIKLESVEVCPKNNSTFFVELGSIVSFMILSSKKQITVEVADEVTSILYDISTDSPQKVSIDSPLGKSLLGKKVGEILEVSQGKKKYQIKVLEIK